MEKVWCLWGKNTGKKGDASLLEALFIWGPQCAFKEWAFHSPIEILCENRQKLGKVAPHHSYKRSCAQSCISNPRLAVRFFQACCLVSLESFWVRCVHSLISVWDHTTLCDLDQLPIKWGWKLHDLSGSYKASWRFVKTHTWKKKKKGADRTAEKSKFKRNVDVSSY